MSITETVLRWLNRQTLPATFSIGTIAQETELERRQVTTALHSLAQGALQNDLGRVGKGLWRYAPDGVPREVDALSLSTRHRALMRSPAYGTTRNVGDHLGQGEIMAVFRSTAEYYLVRNDQGNLYWVFPVDEAEIARIVQP